MIEIFGRHWVGYTDTDVMVMLTIFVVAGAWAAILSNIFQTVPYEEGDDDDEQ